MLQHLPPLEPINTYPRHRKGKQVSCDFTMRNPKRARMSRIKEIITEIDDDVLPVTRPILADEIQEIRDLSNAETSDNPNMDMLINAIGIAYNYGFWLGWRHCETEWS